MKDELDRFYNVCGYHPDLENPKTFCEKLTWKKIFNPNPLEATWADKIKVRELIPKKYLHGAEYSYSPNLTLDKPCILKMNNASGRNELVLNPPKYNQENITKWFTQPYGLSNYEWDAIYKYIKPGVLIETELLSFPHFVYRYWMFKGECAFIQVYKDSIVDGKLVNDEITTYDTSWKKLPYLFKGKINPDVPKPKRLVTMNKLAQELSKPFPFVRVDLFNNDGKIVFNEATFYPQSCKVAMPKKLDLELGEML